MTKKKINIRRADGVVQGYHVGTDNTVTPETVIKPSDSHNPYKAESQDSMSDLDKKANNFINSKDKYSAILENVKNEHPEIYNAYMHVYNGGNINSEGLENIRKTVENITNLNVNEELLEANVNRMLGLFGRNGDNPNYRQMGKVLMTVNAHSAQLRRDLDNNVITKEDYDKKISTIIISSNILNASLMSKDPWV